MGGGWRRVLSRSPCHPPLPMAHDNCASSDRRTPPRHGGGAALLALSQSPRLVAIQTSAAGVASDAEVEKALKKRNPAKAGNKFVHFGGILQTAGDRGGSGSRLASPCLLDAPWTRQVQRRDINSNLPDRTANLTDCPSTKARWWALAADVDEHTYQDRYFGDAGAAPRSDSRPPAGTRTAAGVRG